MQSRGGLALPEINTFTAGTVKLSMFCDEELASTATGFLWKEGEKSFLITNWHNLTGINPETGKCLSSRGSRPTSVEVAWFDLPDGKLKTKRFPLYDEADIALWFVHPTAGEQVDVVALPLGKTSSLGRLGDIPQLNQVNVDDTAKLFIGADVLIAGYPDGMAAHDLAIWKGGTIASEPQLASDQAGKREILLDAATRSGMSGSPVITNVKYQEMVSTGLKMGERRRLIGIYSSRLGDQDDLGKQLGRFWPIDLIERIVKNANQDTFERGHSFTPTDEVLTIRRALEVAIQAISKQSGQNCDE
jgi:hypothetical protein